MKTYSLLLPIYKQGDDFASCAETNNGHPINSLLELSEMYRSAAEICRKVANALSSTNNSSIEISGDTHLIWLNLPEEIGKSLAQEHLLMEEDFSEEIE